MPNRKKKCVGKKKRKNDSNNTSKKKRLSKNKEITDETPHSKFDCPNKIPNANECDKSGVKRILSPFNRVSRSLSTRPPDKTDKHKTNSIMTYQSAYKPSGLSPKEKCYLICSCQARPTRYITLKSHAAEAIRHKKIFSIYGNCNAVRKALCDRGWVEKIPANRINLSKIRNGHFSDKEEMQNELERLLLSNLVEKSIPNFIWLIRDEFLETTIDMGKEYQTIVNKLKIDAMWTSKQGLCTSLKGNYWFYIEDVAEVNSPRTYSSYDLSEVDEFVADYKIAACTSLLKWILSMVANERPIFVETGKISLNVVVFALNRCKEYLFQKQNKDIDKTINCVSTGQWNAFLKKYYTIISKEDVFQIEKKESKLQLYLGYAKFLLKEIHKYRPQLSCEGCHNIWIIKPAHLSRGRGIRMASKLGVITNLLNTAANAKYVVQKYIEEPLLIHDTKFDIRQYYLVTSTYPLVIWMYTDCYLKFSSQKYSLKNYHESIHLTNNAVQKKYQNCTGRHPELPQSNMWDLDTYKSYLIRIGRDKVWNNVIYPGMKKSIISIMLSCQDSLSVSKNRFELYGCDFILDKQYKTWLIEINSCPDLNHTTPVTAKICPAVVNDIIKVVIDYAENPKSSTGKFECVYRQPMSAPRYCISVDLAVRGYSLPLEYFYRGNIQYKETLDELLGNKERDVKAMLNKLKKQISYDTENIMIVPEDDSDSNNKKEQETFTHRSESEDDLHVAATAITGLLDDLLDRITSEHSFSSKSGFQQNAVSPLFSKTSLKNSITQSTKSVTDIKSLLKRSVSRFASTEPIKSKRAFSFSKLDDGSLGKGSIVDVASIKKHLFNAASNNAINQKTNETGCEYQSNLNKKDCATKHLRTNFERFPTKISTSKAHQNIITASNKILTFLQEKEKEYLQSQHRH